jgi:hypothetical protein
VKRERENGNLVGPDALQGSKHDAAFCFVSEENQALNLRNSKGPSSV